MSINAVYWIKLGENQWRSKGVLLEDTSWRELSALRDITLDNMKISREAMSACLVELPDRDTWYLYSAVRDNFIPVNEHDCEALRAVKLYMMLMR